MGMPNLSDKNIREMIARALDVIIQLDRLSDGSRRLLTVTEITGMESGVITAQDIFVFEQKTVDEEGKVRGVFKPTGIRPRFAKKLARSGFEIQPDWLRFEQEV
jgi:pilus assembly protein CpaF